MASKNSYTHYPLSWRQIQKDLTVREVLRRLKNKEFKHQIEVWTGGNWLRTKWQLEGTKVL